MLTNSKKYDTLTVLDYPVIIKEGKHMKLRSVEFWYEGLATLSKNQVAELFQKYLDDGNEYGYDDIDEMFENLYEDGDIDVGTGAVSVVSEVYGVPEELREDVE